MSAPQPLHPTPLTVLVDDVRRFKDERPALVARSSQEALTLLEQLGDTRIDNLWLDGIATNESFLSPGDLVLTPGSDGSLASPGHVGMFIGHGLVVLAPHTGDVVKVVTYASLSSAGVSALRHIG